jgi:predicted ArsR family transcriptional regulator
VSEESFGSRVSRMAALSDPVRRALYRFVAAQPGSVSREQAAAGVEVPPHTARHHLDRLVEEGLLVTEFRRLTGRTGPGAGRPAKLYRRTEAELSVSVPHRSYDLAGDVLAAAVERSLGGEPLHRAVHDAAAEAGERAAGVAERSVRRLSPLRRLARVLAPHGYEPRVERDPDAATDALVLANCPFDKLATDHTELICGMNLSFVGAVADGLGCAGVRPQLDPQPGRCCVRVLESGDPGRDAASPD